MDAQIEQYLNSRQYRKAYECAEAYPCDTSATAVVNSHILHMIETGEYPAMTGSYAMQASPEIVIRLAQCYAPIEAIDLSRFLMDIRSLDNMEIDRLLRRLGTYQFMEQYTSGGWSRFLHIDLISEIAVRFLNDDRINATLIWKRHLVEPGFKDGIQTILHTLPLAADPSFVIKWLNRDVMQHLNFANR